MSSRLGSRRAKRDSSREWAFLRSLGLDDTRHGRRSSPAAAPARRGPGSAAAAAAREASPWAARLPSPGRRHPRRRSAAPARLRPPGPAHRRRHGGHAAQPPPLPDRPGSAPAASGSGSGGAAVRDAETRGRKRGGGGRKQAAGTRAAVGDGNTGGGEARRWARAWAAWGTLGARPRPRGLRPRPPAGPVPPPRSPPTRGPPPPPRPPPPTRPRPTLCPGSGYGGGEGWPPARVRAGGAVIFARNRRRKRCVRRLGRWQRRTGVGGWREGIFFSSFKLSEVRVSGQGWGALRPEPPVVSPKCTLGRGGAALPAGLSSGAPGSPVQPTTQSAVGARACRVVPILPPTHTHM